MAYANKLHQAACCRRHYEANKAAYVERAAQAKKASKVSVRSLILEYLSCHPCVDCGESDAIVLEFDHRAGVSKKFNIGAAVSGGYSGTAVLHEISKCDVRCANCHRRKTYIERGFTHKDTW